MFKWLKPTQFDKGLIAGIHISSRSIKLTIAEEVIPEKENASAFTPNIVVKKDEMEDFPLGFGPSLTSDCKTVLESIRDRIPGSGISKISVASCGPIKSLNKNDRDGAFGCTGANQPQGIVNLDIVESLKGALSASDREYREIRNNRMFVNTDVNCAAVGEFMSRATHRKFPFDVYDFKGGTLDGTLRYDLASTLLVYVIVGSGIGGGFIWGGFRVRDRMHPEMGHARVVKVAGDTIESYCPHHGPDDPCVEGLASEGADFARLLATNDDRQAQLIRAEYIAQMINGVVLALAPSAIVLDVAGGLDARQTLVADVTNAFRRMMGEDDKRYPGYPSLMADKFISLPFRKPSPDVEEEPSVNDHLQACMDGAIAMASWSYRMRQDY